MAARHEPPRNLEETEPLHCQPDGKNQVHANLKAVEYEPSRKMVKIEESHDVQTAKVVYFNEYGELIAASFGPLGELKETEVASDFNHRDSFSAVAVGNAIYVLGWRNHFFKLVLGDGTWRSETIAEPIDRKLWGNPPTHLHGQKPALAVVGDKIFACGGGWENLKEIETLPDETPTPFSNKCEYFDVTTEKWETVADMLQKKRQHSVIAVKGRVYSVGGIGTGKKDVKALRDVEEYNPKTDSWTPRCKLLKARVGPGLAEHGGKIYAIGGGSGVYGTDSFKRRRTIERYDISSDTWEETNLHLSVGRMFFNPVIINDEIIVIGGDKSGTGGAQYSDGSNWEKIDLNKKEEDIPGAASIKSLAVVWIK